MILMGQPALSRFVKGLYAALAKMSICFDFRATRPACENLGTENRPLPARQNAIIAPLEHI